MKTKLALFVAVFLAGTFLQAADKPKQKDGPVIIDTKKPMVSFYGDGPMIFADNGSKFAYVSGNKLHIWDVKNAKRLRQMEIKKHLFNKFSDRSWEEIQGLTNTAMGNELQRQPHRLTISKNGKVIQLLTAANHPNALEASWSMESGAEIHTDRTQQGTWALSPDEKTMAIGIRGGTVFFKDTSTGKITSKLKAHTDRVWGLTYSNDGKFLATASRYTDGTVKIWRLKDFKEIIRIPKHDGSNYSVAFSPDASLLATTNDNHYIRIWELPPLK